MDRSTEYSYKVHRVEYIPHLYISMAKKKAVKCTYTLPICYSTEIADDIVQRGVATTSVASKKQVEDAKAVKEAEAAALAEKEAAPTAIDLEATSGSEFNLPKDTDGAADWEDDGYVEKQTLQSLVDRLNDKGDKEVTRVVKVSLQDCSPSDSSPSNTTDVWHPPTLL
jgi:hypothetical protein